MKKSLLLLTFLLSVASICFAGTPRRGYRGFVDWGFSIGDAFCNNMNCYEPYGDPVIRESQLFLEVINTTHGYQFNNHFFAGIGFMLSISHGNEMIPVYADFRYDDTFGKFSPFFDFRLGFNENKGVYVSPTIGYKFSLGKRMNLNLGLGLTFAGDKNEEYYMTQYHDAINDYTYYKSHYLRTEHHLNHLFTFRIGFDF